MSVALESRASRAESGQERASAMLPVLRPFRAADYVALHALCSRTHGQPLVDDPMAVGAAYAASGPAFTALSGGCVMAIAGLVLIWPGRASAWAVLNPAARGDLRAALWITIQIRKSLRVLARAHGLRRIEAQARRDDPRAIRWLMALGFTAEGELDRYGPDGADYLAFSRLTEDARG